MTLRKPHTFLNSATAASVSSTFPCDYKLEDNNPQRTLYGTLTGGASVNLYLTVTDPEQGTVIRHLEETVSVASSAYTTATNSFAFVINGPVSIIEVVKADGTGTATVIGLV